MNNKSALLFTSDMMSSIRIEAAAANIKFECLVVSSPEDLGPADPVKEGNYPGEATSGPLGVLMNKITLWQPNILIFDLGSATIPWEEWIGSLKSVPATRNFPIICYGPHIDEQRLERARSLGADLVVPRSRFFNKTAQLITDYAKVDDKDAIEKGCRGSLSDSAIKGLMAFNQQRYFDAHEYLEDAWNEEQGYGREIYRGILQVAVAYLQIERRNFDGAIKMLLRSRQWLNPLPDRCRGINIGQLQIDKEAVYDELKSLGPKRIHEFNTLSFKPVKYYVISDAE